MTMIGFYYAVLAVITAFIAAFIATVYIVGKNFEEVKKK